MSRVSQLIREHAPIFERPEFRFELAGARIRLEFEQEAWLAATDEERLVLRPARHDDPAPDLVVRLGDEGFARHMVGELDLFWSVERRFSMQVASERWSHAELSHHLRRVLTALSLSCQCGERFRGSVVEELYLADRSPRQDGAFEPMGDWSLPFYAGKILYDLVTSQGLERTVEVGMAHALSTLFIAQAHRDNGGGRHVAIDPWQATGFGRAGWMNVERAGLDGFVELIEETNYAALPRLAADDPGGYQLAFIDGLHIFDHVLLDFFYCDLLLEEGGYIVFDDSTKPAVQSVLNFVVENRSDSFERLEDLSTERIAVFRKIGGDVRIDKFGVGFHRPFDAAGPEIAPLPPPPGPHTLKRVFDLTLGLLACVVALPVGIAISAAILLEDLLAGDGLKSPFRREPVISRGARFDMIRFRTSRPSQGPDQTSRVGSVLARFHLDGLPVLLGVLSGDLSFVGHSPIGLHEHVRHRLFAESGMRAGLLGPRQARGGSGGDVAEYYREYVGRSQLSLLALDLSLIARFLVRRLRSAFSRA